ncbi:Gfo/Idh/MocA family oxidoreductase [Candidatus Pacearchaeota archaeon]|nr:Gfo/Idh/MocA family oxidoreductase [Candidatus Pacearchaeota archaeon]
MTQTILLVGFGYHARRIYYPILKSEKSRYNFIIIDIINKKESIEEFFSSEEFKPVKIVFLKQFSEELKDLPETAYSKLDSLIKIYRPKGIIISSDPLYHRQYAKWALKNDISVLMDKPISAHKDMCNNIDKAEELNKDYEDLYSLYKCKKDKILFSIVSQRRFHKGFQRVRKLIKEIFDKTNCPITSIQISHSDGQWRLPNEIIDIDYHSFNHGFGKCSHSGYHFVDILNFFFDATKSEDKKIDNVEVFSNFLKPTDYISQIELKDYYRLFKDFDKYNKYDQEELISKMKNFGEIDAFINMRFRKGEKTITLCSLNLIHNSFSQRGNLIPNKNLYKGNGRIRHESYIIQQGPFQCIHIDSLQSSEIKLGSEPNYDTGGEYHFDIHIFRNDKFNKEWKNYEKISIRQLQNNLMPKLSRGHQEDARREAVLEFLNYLEGSRKKGYISDFTLHRNSVRLISAIYKSAASKVNDLSPIVETPYEQ